MTHSALSALIVSFSVFAGTAGATATKTSTVTLLFQTKEGEPIADLSCALEVNGTVSAFQKTPASGKASFDVPANASIVPIAVLRGREVRFRPREMEDRDYLNIGIAIRQQKPLSGPIPTTITVQDTHDVPFKNANVFLVSLSSGKTREFTTDEQGKVSLTFPRDELFRITCITHIGVFTFDRLPDKPLPADTGHFDLVLRLSSAERVFTTVPSLLKGNGVDYGSVYLMNNVYFDPGRATLTASSKKAVGDLDNFLRVQPKVKVEIAGHTDSTGDPAFNKTLSMRRAQSVVDILVKRGIKKNRLIAVGYGPSQPVASNKTAAGRRKNRRTEIRVLKPK